MISIIISLGKYLTGLKKKKSGLRIVVEGGPWLAQTEECVTVDLEIGSLSPIMGVEVT